MQRHRSSKPQFNSQKAYFKGGVSLVMKRLYPLTLCFLLGHGTVYAQNYPSHPLHIVIPFPPGGGYDGIARPFAELLSSVLGQAVVLDNKAGAAGNIGTEAVVRASPDGYTLLFASDILGTNPSLYKNLKYDPQKDLAPIALVATTQLAIAVNPLKVKAQTAKALLTESLEHDLHYGSPGVGTPPHLFAELYAFHTGTKMTQIPYKGTGPAITDVLGGQVDLVLVTVPALAPYIRSGKLKGITVIGGNKRSALIPEVPTLAENGIFGINQEVWYGLFAPALTPPEVLKKLRFASAQALSQNSFIEKMHAHGYEVEFTSPEALSERLKEDLAKWPPVVERAHISVE